MNPQLHGQMARLGHRTDLATAAQTRLAAQVGRTAANQVAVIRARAKLRDAERRQASAPALTPVGAALAP